MKGTKFAAALFGIFAAVLAVFTVWVCGHAMGAKPVLLQEPKEAVQRADAMLAAVCEGDYALAGTMLSGSPRLTAGDMSEDEATALLWNAFVKSVHYTLADHCYATDTGVALDVHVTGLKISSVTDSLSDRSQNLLEERVAAAVNVEEIYDAENNYREDFVKAVLLDAVRDALCEDAVFEERDITLHFSYDDGQWWILPEPELMDFISGCAA